MRLIFVLGIAFVLAACATAPPQAPISGGPAGDLSVCAGMGISNAPATDGRGQIVNYDPITRVAGESIYRAPVSACVSSGFGPRRGGASGFHEGIDLFTRSPREIYAGGDGVVESVDTMRGYGRTVLIRHNRRLKTRYAHLSAYARGLSRGDRVRRGEVIGLTGQSGNATAVHLHYEVLIDGRPHDPLTVGE